jgi:hypothetical protein
MIVFQCLIGTRPQKANLTRSFNDLFKISKGVKPAQGSILRSSSLIKAVFFAQPDELLTLTLAHAHLRDGAIDLLHYNDYEFTESVLLGFWGTIAVFFSHVVIWLSIDDFLLTINAIQRCQPGLIPNCFSLNLCNSGDGLRTLQRRASLF